MSLTARCADQLTQGQNRWSIPLPTFSKPLLIAELARVCVAGELTVAGVSGRLESALGRKWRWILPFAKRYVAALDQRTRPSIKEVERFFRSDRGFRRAWTKHRTELRVLKWIAGPQAMQPVKAAERWDVPPIESVGALADWLKIEVGELEWLADLKGLAYRVPDARLRHYHYRAQRKSSGGVRLIEAPKQRLKEMQRRILAEILERVPAHPAAHGFVRGRSIGTYAASHLKQTAVLRMDLKDFFPSLRAARIQAFFRTAGYPDSVASLLTGICTGTVPRDFWKGVVGQIPASEIRDARMLYTRPHLPQGSPTSPALANICCYRMDCRLSGLAASTGCEYTRYADDLTFSGSAWLRAHAGEFLARAASIATEEGFEVNHRKTRVMPRDTRQYIAGLVVNERLNIVRKDFDRLKAILTNCAKHGPDGQNRERHPAFAAHLLGRIAFVESIHPTRGARLRKIFERIRWE